MSRHQIKPMHGIVLLLLSLERQEGWMVEQHINVLPLCAGTEMKAQAVSRQMHGDPLKMTATV